MSGEIARRGDLERRQDLPGELREAILEAANLIVAALPPGVQLHLTFEDASDLGYDAAELVAAAAEQRRTKALMVPGRLDVRLTVSGREGYFYPAGDGHIETHVDADGALVDGDADGVFDEIVMTSWNLAHWRIV